MILKNVSFLEFSISWKYGNIAITFLASCSMEIDCQWHQLFLFIVVLNKFYEGILLLHVPLCHKKVSFLSIS